jgi:hypothetical protein
VHIQKMAGWKFIAEFRRGRKDPLALQYFVAVPDLEQAQIIAATKLVGADEITIEPLSSFELRRLAIKDGEAAFR